MLRFFVRSPHLLEVLVAYGGVHVISVWALLRHFGATYSELASGYVVGSAFYTLIEYWFHRTVLHHWIFARAHKFHHDNPTKLRIIATPLLAVQAYETCMMIALSLVFGVRTAVWVQVGVSVSQIVMDFVHLYEHSAYNPWFLRAARNYHKLHHHKQNWDVGHGLTTRFWDLVFDTCPVGNGCSNLDTPKAWPPYEQRPWLKYLTVPLPLLDFVLITPFVAGNGDCVSGAARVDWRGAQPRKLAIALASAVWVGLSPFFVEWVRTIVA